MRNLRSRVCRSGTTAGTLVLTLFLAAAAPLCPVKPRAEAMNSEKWCCCGACCGWAVDCKAVPGCNNC